ncbi:MAG: molybdenum cofactor guanylyltransferase [Syntrophales bacterium]|nr:molybdenum cofactor guanylyltransferase [Syntrophales bacterium]
MISGVVLAGGLSTRMGFNKAFIEVCGERIIDRTVRVLKEIFPEVILVTNDPLLYLDLDCIIVTDVLPDKGPLMGIYTALLFANYEYVFVVACDMPFLSADFIRFMSENRQGFDVVVPSTADGLHPLHALYSKRCMKKIYNQIKKDELKVSVLYKGLRNKIVTEDEIRAFGDPRLLLKNINTKNELTFL